MKKLPRASGAKLTSSLRATISTQGILRKFNHSTGPGANPSAPDPHSHQLTDGQAQKVNPEKLLRGDEGWNPEEKRMRDTKGGFGVKVKPAALFAVDALASSNKSQLTRALALV